MIPKKKIMYTVKYFNLKTPFFNYHFFTLLRHAKLCGQLLKTKK